jgi:hypothetical protein
MRIKRYTKETEGAAPEAIAERWQREADTLSAGPDSPLPLAQAPKRIEAVVTLTRKV